uniref:Uncharacterized protein n=1 Tax=Faxonius propinquus nudivirus TaxID=3139431 RepID=A0AAU8GD02_9VIRU
MIYLVIINIILYILGSLFILYNFLNVLKEIVLDIFNLYIIQLTIIVYKEKVYHYKRNHG